MTKPVNAHRPEWLPDPEDPTQWRYWDGTRWTDHRSPRGEGGLPPSPASAYLSRQGAPAYRPPLSAPPPAQPTGKWYFVITLASVGILACVPFFHAASRLGKPSLNRWGIGFAVAGFLPMLLIGPAPETAQGEPTGFFATLGGLLAMAVMLVASLMLIGIRRQVYDRVLIKAPSRNQGAMASVAESRRRRTEARRIAVTDPMMARELGIGRPSLDRYDDGGLVDLNLASAQELVAVAGLSEEAAQGVVEARQAIGRFLSVDDAIVYGQVSEDQTDLLRERGIVIGGS